MPLIYAKPGEQGIIKRVGGTQDIRTHMANLGFVAGASVTVINKVNGNIIVNIKETRIAVSRELAAKIFI